MSKNVLLMGFAPSVADFNKYPQFDPASLQKAIEKGIDELKQKGVDVTAHFLQDDGEDPARTVRWLAEKTYDIVMVGAGVRTDPEKLLLFEKIINIVHKMAPQASICFNTRQASDLSDAVQRWM